MAAAGGVLQLKSCGSAPCKVVERFFERSVHPRRILRRQYLLTPGFERLRRRAAASSRVLQRPEKMLAGVAQSDAQAIVMANLVIECSDIGELQRKRWRRFGDPAIETAPDLPGQPGLALRAAADHDRIGAGNFERAQR